MTILIHQLEKKAVEFQSLMYKKKSTLVLK